MSNKNPYPHHNRESEEILDASALRRLDPAFGIHRDEVCATAVAAKKFARRPSCDILVVSGSDQCLVLDLQHGAILASFKGEGCQDEAEAMTNGMRIILSRQRLAMEGPIPSIGILEIEDESIGALITIGDGEAQKREERRGIADGERQKAEAREKPDDIEERIVSEMCLALRQLENQPEMEQLNGHMHAFEALGLAWRCAPFKAEIYGGMGNRVSLDISGDY